jgi:hypothetical protein
LRDVLADLAAGGGLVGGVRRLIMVPRPKLFFPEEHPRLMSVLLQEFWRSIA